MTIMTLDYCGTGLSFDGTAVHGTGMFAGVCPDVVKAAAAAARTTNKLLGIRPRRPEPA